MKEFLAQIYHWVQIKTFLKFISIMVIWFVLLGVTVTLNNRKSLYHSEQLEKKEVVYMKLEKGEKFDSYLFTDNLGKQYRLGANSQRCFDEHTFLKEVKVADTMIVSTTEQEWSKEIPLIYSLSTKNKSYVTLRCSRKSNKTGILPLLTTAGFYLVTFILVFNALNYLILRILSLINNKRSK